MNRLIELIVSLFITTVIFTMFISLWQNQVKKINLLKDNLNERMIYYEEFSKNN